MKALTAYIGSAEGFVMPPNEYYLSGVAEYMRKHNVEFNDIPKEVLETFKFQK